MSKDQFSCLLHLINPGVNCTQEDLEAIISDNEDVELLDLDTEKLYYEVEYK